MRTKQLGTTKMFTFSGYTALLDEIDRDVSLDFDTNVDVDIDTRIDRSSFDLSGFDNIVFGTGDTASVSFGGSVSGSGFSSISGSAFAAVGDGGTAVAGGSFSAGGENISFAGQIQAGGETETFGFQTDTSLFDLTPDTFDF